MSFEQIDAAIDEFIAGKEISVSKVTQSDWLVFDWRQLTWKGDEINYVIEIYPNFEQDGFISSWTLYTAAFYDLDNKRYYSKKEFATGVPLETIAENLAALLTDSYEYISKIPKGEIPFALDLSSLTGP